MFGKGGGLGVESCWIRFCYTALRKIGVCRYALWAQCFMVGHFVSRQWSREGTTHHPL